MATYYTKNVLQELSEVLKANSDIEFVAFAPVVPLEQESNKTAVYISLESELSSLENPGLGVDSYNRVLLIPLTVNADCTGDEFLIYDLVNSIERSILKDTLIWGQLIDRNVVSVEYDNAKFHPKRTAIVLLEVLYRLSC